MVNKKPHQPKRVLSVFTLAMISVALIASLRGLPTMAEYGLGSIFFYVLITITFLLPVSLVSAELATGWPETGGLYIWIREALGPRTAFFAIFIQWVQVQIWIPTVLAFGACSLAYVITPELAENRYYTLAIVLGVYWAATFINFLGMKASGLVSSVGVIAGTILPGALLIIFAIIWLAKGNPSQITFSARKLVPDMGDINNLVFFASSFLFFAGMEVSAVHAREVKNPQRDYPKAIFMALIIVFVLFSLATLAVAIVVPKKSISLVAGVMQACTCFLESLNIKWLVQVLAVLIFAGAIAQTNSWVVGPSKSLFASARAGDIPPFFEKFNRHHVPIRLLVAQACITSLISLVIFLLVPSVSAAFLLLGILGIMLYLIVYILMYISAIRLHHTKPDVDRAFKVPGGNIGMWLVSGGGIVCAIAVMVIGFFPPETLNMNIFFYEGFLVVGIILVCTIPLVIYHFRNEEWAIDYTKQDH